MKIFIDIALEPGPINEIIDRNHKVTSSAECGQTSEHKSRAFPITAIKI